MLRIIPIAASIQPEVVISIAIKWLRVKHNIVIYDYMAPFVCLKTKKIIFCYAAKKCNIRDGWNGRIFIGKSEYLDDPLECKFQAINLALDFIENKNMLTSLFCSIYILDVRWGANCHNVNISLCSLPQYVCKCTRHAHLEKYQHLKNGVIKYSWKLSLSVGQVGMRYLYQSMRPYRFVE